MSGFAATPATAGMVMAELGAQGYHPRPRVENQRYDEDILEVTLVAEQGVSHVMMVANQRTGELTIKIDGQEIGVSSLFNNGSGFFFRDGDGHEFFYVDVQDRKVVYSPTRGRAAKWDTHEAWRYEMVQNQIEHAKAETAKIASELEEMRTLLAEAMLLASRAHAGMSTDEDIETLTKKVEAVTPDPIDERIYLV